MADGGRHTPTAGSIAASCRVLEVPCDVSDAELKQAYRDLARIWHPDRFPTDERLRKKAEKRFAEINRAYNLLIRISEAERRHACWRGVEDYSSRDAAACHIYTDTEKPSCSPARAPTAVSCLSLVALARLGFAFAACAAAIFGGAVLYDTLLRPFRETQTALQRVAGSTSPAVPALPNLSQLIDQVNLQVPIDPPQADVQPDKPRADDASSASRIQSTTRLRRGGRKRVEKRDIRYGVSASTETVTAEWTRSSIPGEWGELILTNNTPLDCVLDFHDQLGMHVPPFASRRIGSVNVGMYTLKLRLGFDWNGRSLRQLAEPVRIGPFLFVRVRGAAAVSDRYDLRLTNGN